jgi:AcrR family transcriptional regulator
VPTAQESAVRRTGGRSARVRAAVHDAARQLIDAGADVTVAAVAAGAGVNPTSIYRRWGTVEALVLDVEGERLAEGSPLPDTGSLRGDLLLYARRAAADITRPGGLAFIRALVLAPAGVEGAPSVRGRGAAIQAMLDRARDRGERALRHTDVLDGILAPIYLRTLLGIGGLDARRREVLVDRLLGSAPSR